MARRTDARQPLLAAALVLVALGTGCTSLKRCAYEGYGRDGWQKPEQVVRSLEVARGDDVADLGSGGGYFTFRLADAVGPEGVVYAVDVEPGLNEHVTERARDEGYENVDVVLAVHQDPLLPVSGVNLIFTSNTYHHIEDRVDHFENARQYLRAGGRVAIIDYNGKGWFQRIFPHFTGEDVIKREMQAAGYRFLREFDFLPRQNFLVFAIASQ